MSKVHSEEAFESIIEEALISNNGYIKVNSESFNREICLNVATLISFIQTTQSKEWKYLEKIHGAKATELLIKDICLALNSENEGCMRVLRHGFKCFGKTFRIAFFAPASGLNPETRKLYDSNILTITRQLRYSDKHNKTLDLVISLNGLPIITAELKNPLTGQTWRDAIRQYKNDRDPKDLLFQFKKRTLVHFAVDPDEVHMTTKLNGRTTRFLPFNRGNQSGRGNPINPNGHKTSYLWEDIWTRDSILEIIGRFLHLEVKQKKIGDKKIKIETMIFPRYHQLQAVRMLIDDAQKNESGNNYLIQHSTGSGKSFSITWLAYRLSSLHNAIDKKIFDSVVVVTDRLVLDQQLQDTIYQIEHKAGVVQKIDVDSSQLAGALESGIPIIITTLHKFPFVANKIDELPAKTYAVIIDEAHSSQSGEMAADMKGVLSGEQIREEVKEIANDDELLDYEEEIIRTIAKRGRQSNISFFAFTATPKYKTIVMFGHRGVDNKPEPFHLYTMRQAIEEKFILDVLQNYTTYKTYFQLQKTNQDNPEVDRKKAAKALKRFVSLHEDTISIKTEIMMKHFLKTTKHRIGGKAKSMVVTSSRLHAVRYKLAFDKYIKEHNLSDIKMLVAFSGKVPDPLNPGVEYTEVGMNNGIKMKELPEKFATEQYKILIVAEKYQTGFDQPLLHTMFIDKRLAGLQAVQTLSRLNRTCPGKDDTFALDFVNPPEEIQAAFQPYYERTMIGEEAHPRQLYELQARLEEFQVFYRSNVEEFSKVFYIAKQKQTFANHAKMNACIDVAVARFNQLENEDKETFRKILVAYRNLYAFLSQIMEFKDLDLEKSYSYIRFLLMKIPKGRGDTYRFDDEVALEYYRLRKTHEGIIELEAGKGGDVIGPTSVGTGATIDDQIKLTELIDILNERFGTDFTSADQLFFDSLRDDAIADSELRQVAVANTLENFGYVFLRTLEGLFIDRLEQNEDISAKFFNDLEFQDIVSQHLMEEVYDRIRGEEVHA